MEPLLTEEGTKLVDSRGRKAGRSDSIQVRARVVGKSMVFGSDLGTGSLQCDDGRGLRKVPRLAYGSNIQYRGVSGSEDHGILHRAFDPPFVSTQRRQHLRSMCVADNADAVSCFSESGQRCHVVTA